MVGLIELNCLRFSCDTDPIYALRIFYQKELSTLICATACYQRKRNAKFVRAEQLEIRIAGGRLEGKTCLVISSFNWFVSKLSGPCNAFRVQNLSPPFLAAVTSRPVTLTILLGVCESWMEKFLPNYFFLVLSPVHSAQCTLPPLPLSWWPPTSMTQVHFRDDSITNAFT